jgi:hypothetical protein
LHHYLSRCLHLRLRRAKTFDKGWTFSALTKIKYLEYGDQVQLHLGLLRQFVHGAGQRDSLIEVEEVSFAVLDRNVLQRNEQRGPFQTQLCKRFLHDVGEPAIIDALFPEWRPKSEI